MTEKYERYEQACAALKKENASLLAEFKTWLKQANMTEKTVNAHASRVSFYINEFLLYEDPLEAKQGVHYGNRFLGYWFIKKAMWASPAQLKSNAASLKKFYSFMLEKNQIEQAEFDKLRATIKDKMPAWLAALKRYDDPEIKDRGEVWWGGN